MDVRSAGRLAPYSATSSSPGACWREGETTDAAARLGVARVTLQRVVNTRAGVLPRLAIALERLGWSDAGHWVRMQGAYDLARARRELDAVA